MPLTPNDPLIGKKLGTYRIIRRLGMGGMGTVYVGMDETLKREVAIKVIHEQFRENPEYRDRLLREAQSLASLTHPNIAPIFTAGEQDDILYFAMQLIPGRDLHTLMMDLSGDGEMISYEDVLKIISGVASALDYAHDRGIIHRDIKPGNVIIDTHFHVFLTDFGLALDKQLEPHSGGVGTVHYISPEQAQGATYVIPQSDLYSLGVMLYELLTGSLPFDDPNPVTVVIQHLNNQPQSPRQVNPKLTLGLERVILKSLEKDPLDRYQTGDQLVRELTRAIKDAKKEGTNRISLPALPVGTRAKHGLETVETASKKRPADRTIPLSVAALRNTQTRPREGIPTLPNQPREENRFLWLGLGVFGTLAMVALIFIVIGLINNRSAASALPSLTPSLTFLPSTPALTFTTSPTSLPSATTQTLEPIFSPTPPPPPTTPPSVVTGDLFILIYDETSFNMFNASDENRDISLIIFQRLDANNVVLDNFTGEAWARFNAISRPETCMRIEITDAPFNTLPDECNNLFDATRTTAYEADFNFWTFKPGSTEFRVMWGAVEIARCKISAMRCEIHVP